MRLHKLSLKMQIKIIHSWLSFKSNVWRVGKNERKFGEKFDLFYFDMSGCNMVEKATCDLLFICKSSQVRFFKTYRLWHATCDLNR